MQLSEFFKENPRLAVAFSGGADSAFLLYSAKNAGCNVTAYYIDTPFQPRRELVEAQTMAENFGVKLTVLNSDPLTDPKIAENPHDRCYHCKKALFTVIMRQCTEDGCDVLCDGTNFDDDPADRPGMRVLAELKIKSPLRDCGCTKADIRALSKEAGLQTHDKPSYSCLATRIPTDCAITHELLKKIECAETFLLKNGFSDFRVRLLPPNSCIIQLRLSQLQKIMDVRQLVLDEFGRSFDKVLFDLKPR